jgi:hypothetical protein
MAWAIPYYSGGEKWFLNYIPPFSDEVIPNPPLHWFMKLQRIGKEYQQFVPNPPYPKVFGAWSQFKVQMWPEDLQNWPPFGTVKVRTPIDENGEPTGWKQWVPPIKVNMRYFPVGEYVVPHLPPEMYDELEEQRSQRERTLGQQLPRIVPSPSESPCAPNPKATSFRC